MTAPKFKPIAPRLEEKSAYVPFCGCRIWFGPSVPRGYGVISVNGKQTYTHRAAWSVYRGPIPLGMQVLHACDVPACINVEHLFLGNQSQNVQDMLKKKRGNYVNRARGASHHMSAGGYKGEKHPRSKLIQQDVDSIRSKYKSGATQTKLAKLFAVSQSQISSIVRGESWA